MRASRSQFAEDALDQHLVDFRKQHLGMSAVCKEYIGSVRVAPDTSHLAKPSEYFIEQGNIGMSW